MLEILGSGYVIEHCIAALDDLSEKRAFEAYVTDCLKALTENTAGEAKNYMKSRYVELVNFDTKPRKEQSAEEIKSNIFGKLKAMSEGGEEP